MRNHWKIEVGDCLEVLEKMKSNSVHCVVTSPPYWGLRAYKGDSGMIGLEPTFDEHLDNLVAVFREVRRVLRGDGTLWLNYGDAYAANAKGTGGTMAGMEGPAPGGRRYEPFKLQHGLKPKDLMMMPARVAMALQADGWYLRSEIIWHKPNPMPESCRDRPTSAHEKIYLLSKNSRYFYDAEAVRVESITGDMRRPYGSQGAWEMDGRPDEQKHGGELRTPKDIDGRGARLGRAPGWRKDTVQPVGANLRNVWKIATHAYRAAHFATFPPALVEPCIKAGTSEKGCCSECGAPFVRVVENTGYVNKREPAHVPGNTPTKVDSTGWAPTTRATNVWQPTCTCNAEVVPCVVLDPFNGAGTTGVVALRHNRNYIGIEINPEYSEMTRDRIIKDMPLFNEVTELP